MLAPARIAQIDDREGLIGLQIRRRIVERETGVFADAREAAIDRELTQPCADTLALATNVAFVTTNLDDWRH